MTTAFHEELSEMAKYAARENAAMRAAIDPPGCTSAAKLRQPPTPKPKAGRIIPNSTASKVYAKLEVAPAPMSARQIGDKLGLKRQAVASALNGLMKYNRVRQAGWKGRAVLWEVV